MPILKHLTLPAVSFVASLAFFLWAPTWPALGALLVTAGFCAYARYLDSVRERRDRDFAGLSERLAAVETMRAQLVRIQNKIGIAG